jgi:hypothetical protein
VRERGGVVLGERDEDGLSVRYRRRWIDGESSVYVYRYELERATCPVYTLLHARMVRNIE